MAVPPAPRRRHSTVAIVLVSIVVVLVLAAAAVTGAFLLTRGDAEWASEAPPPGWVEVGFVVGDSPGEAVLTDACLFLRAWARGFGAAKAECFVRAGGVAVAAPPGSEADLDEFVAAVPSRTTFELRPVRETEPRTGACAPEGSGFCGIDGTAKYLVDPARLTGDNIDDVAVSDNDGSFAVTVSLDAAGRAAIQQLSSELQPDGAAAIVVAGAVVSAPQFSTQIAGDMQVTASSRSKVRLIAATFRLGQNPVALRPGDPN